MGLKAENRIKDGYFRDLEFRDFERIRWCGRHCY